ncbi:hypothetical protein [Azohydromonas lata]|uniref:Uncharacterized protein n=1 Tax=Azohydromonas lata TaxID=45677 RepID=A0ABU5I8X1_9BURK|nr:hypothetical protein [Azohydromonas lata]MDZ5455289.1 hypothetical protein [Azohydromonas lata]
MDLFSLVTGMLVYVTLMRRAQPWWACLARRVRCIHLAFPAAFTVYLVVAAAMPAPGKLFDRGLSAYLLTNVLRLPALLLITPVTVVAWSLPYEMFLYLAASLVMGLCCLRQRPASWHAGAPAVLSAGLLARAVAAVPPDGRASFLAAVATPLPCDAERLLAVAPPDGMATRRLLTARATG